MLSLLLAAFVLELVVPLRINQTIREPIGNATNVTSGYALHADTVTRMCSWLAYGTTSQVGYCQKGNMRTSYGEFIVYSFHGNELEGATQ